MLVGSAARSRDIAWRISRAWRFPGSEDRREPLAGHIQLAAERTKPTPLHVVAGRRLLLVVRARSPATLPCGADGPGGTAVTSKFYEPWDNLIREISENSPNTALVILSIDESEPSVIEFMNAGAMSYLRKGTPAAEITNRLHESIAAHRTFSGT